MDDAKKREFEISLRVKAFELSLATGEYSLARANEVYDFLKGTEVSELNDLEPTPDPVGSEEPLNG